MTLLKNTIKNISLEEEKLEESEWMRKLLSTKCDVDTVLIKLIRSK